GSGLNDLLEGILLGPMRHPGVFSLEYRWPPLLSAWAVLSLAGCGAACFLHRKNSAPAAAFVAVLRILFAVAVIVVILLFPYGRAPDYVIFGFALPFVWLFAWRLPDDDPKSTCARNWVVWILLGQYLHAFPVPGSQIAWASVLIVPLTAASAWDA